MERSKQEDSISFLDQSNQGFVVAKIGDIFDAFNFGKVSNENVINARILASRRVIRIDLQV